MKQPKDTSIFLGHILESVNFIEERLKNTSKEALENDIALQDSIIRRLEIIGEASRNIPEEFRHEHPEIPWRDILDTRNILIHDYFGIDLKLVWEIITNDIPKLKLEIEKILKTL